MGFWVFLTQEKAYIDESCVFLLSLQLSQMGEKERERERKRERERNTIHILSGPRLKEKDSVLRGYFQF